MQQLDVWTPERSELFLRIFVLYPPPVSLLWFLLDGTNWWFMLVAIGLTLVQVRFGTVAYIPCLSLMADIRGDRAICWCGSSAIW